MKTLPSFSLETLCQRFGCTPDAARKLFASNAASLATMAEKAERTGRKVNGYTAEQLRASAANALARSKEGSAGA